MPKETILILDNEHYIQWTLKTLLESEGYFTVTGDNVETALNHCSKDEICGFITEYCINSSCTLEAIRDLKEMFPEIYIMMLTNYEVNEKEYEEIINAGVDDFFKKPLLWEKLILHLKKGLRHREILIQKCQLEQELRRNGHWRKIVGKALVKKNPVRMASRLNEFALKNIRKKNIGNVLAATK